MALSLRDLYKRFKPLAATFIERGRRGAERVRGDQLAGNRVVSNYFAPTNQVRARDVIRELPGATRQFGADILRATPRATIALTQRVNQPGQFVPETRFEKFVLGKQPIRPTMSNDVAQALQRRGINPRLAGLAATGAALGGLALDVTGAGGASKKTISALAKANKADDVVKALKTAKIPQDARLVSELVKETDPKKIASLIKSKPGFAKLPGGVSPEEDRAVTALFTSKKLEQVSSIPADARPSPLHTDPNKGKKQIYYSPSTKKAYYKRGDGTIDVVPEPKIRQKPLTLAEGMKERFGWESRSPDPLEALKNEARKYKSAEEFVKAKLNKFHGTTDKGFKLDENKHIFLTDDFDNANTYAGYRYDQVPSGEVVGFHAKEGKILDLTNEEELTKFYRQLKGADKKKLTVFEAIPERYDYINSRGDLDVLQPRQYREDFRTWQELELSQNPRTPDGFKRETGSYSFDDAGKKALTETSEAYSVFSRPTRQDVYNNWDSIIEKAKKEGYDYVKHITEDPSASFTFDETVALNPGKSLLTKSQLTDLYNEAKRATETLKKSRRVIKPPEPPRGFLETVKTAKGTPEFVKTKVKEIAPQGYTPQALNPAVKAATKRVEINFNEALTAFRVKPWNQESGVLGQELVKKNLADGRIDDALNLIEEIDIKAREAGRGIQSLSAWTRMTPEGMIRFAQREIEKANQGRILRKIPSLEKEAAVEIAARMKKVQLMSDGPERIKAVQEVMEIINKQIPPGVSEILDAYRYQNMLSSPLSQLRNIYSNTVQALITRPATLGTSVITDWVGATLRGNERKYYASQVPQYYKQLLNSFPNAVEAFKKVWSGKQVFTQPDLKGIRASSLPKSLTVTTRLMEGMDRFGQTLVSAGEYAARKAAGDSDEVAQAAAEQVAQYSLFRQALDPNNTSGQGLALSYIDKFTQGVTDFGKKFPPLRWFVPFIQTPMNIAKQGIEYSPLGIATLPGAVNKTEQSAKALMGSIMMSIGAVAALQGRTTWEAPTDKEQKDLFYASGKKPFSVLIGKKWVPMWYAGPFSLALALPAAAKYYQDESRTALSDDQMDKLGRTILGAGKFWVNQTSLKGLGDFVKFTEGDKDYTIGKTIGSTAGQLVPAASLMRYVNSILDPVYRRATTFTEQLKSGMPGFSTDLEPYTNPLGELSKRNLSNFIAPWGVGIRDPRFEQAEKERKLRLQTNAVVNKQRKELERTAGKAKAAESDITELVDGRAYVVIDGKVRDFKSRKDAELAVQESEFNRSGKKRRIIGDILYYRDFSGKVKSTKFGKLEEPKLTKDTVLNKKLIGSFNSSITSRQSKIIDLFREGVLSEEEASSAMKELEAMRKKALKKASPRRDSTKSRESRAKSRRIKSRTGQLNNKPTLKGRVRAPRISVPQFKPTSADIVNKVSFSGTVSRPSRTIGRVRRPGKIKVYGKPKKFI